MTDEELEIRHAKWEAAYRASGCNGCRDKLAYWLIEEKERLTRLLQQMLDVAENCDETGYIDGLGWVDIDKLHDEVRSAISAASCKNPE